MRILPGRTCLAGIGMLTLLSLVVCRTGRADDDAKPSKAPTESAAKPASTTKAESGLTEREQLLLDKMELLLDNVERLQKRVEELEAKEHAGNPGATTAPTNAAKEVVRGGPAGIPATALGNSAVPATTAAGSASAGFTPSLGSIQPAALPSGQPKQDPSTGAAATAVANDSKKPVEPFSDADWTWLNGNPRTKEIYWDTKFFTPEVRADTNYVANFNHPADHTISGSSELFRSYE